jgi:MFS family permease
VALFAAAAVLLVSFVVIELRAEHPLLPMRVVLHRDRGGSFLASLLIGTAMFGTFISLTYYFQGTLHYSALKSGFAFLPFSLGIITGATLASRFLPRIGPRMVMVPGLAMAAGGLFLFSTLDVHSTYLSVVLPAELIVSVGMGMAFVTLSSTALIGVHPEDAGVASALVNSTQQTGGSLGAALINTIATTATASFIVVHGHSPAALEAGAIHGYTAAFTFSGIVLAVAAVSTFGLIRRMRNQEQPVGVADDEVFVESDGAVALAGAGV